MKVYRRSPRCSDKVASPIPRHHAQLHVSMHVQVMSSPSPMVVRCLPFQPAWALLYSVLPEGSFSMTVEPSPWSTDCRGLAAELSLS